ncbi:uncharacterized protein PpBr36_10725 [Pyricularia pennisetigena]|uniref:uncharacterized protein n=1 Tax=Pyricularia pennisetigena TaxID=1578925 RepID=UPI001154D0A9|nr:uncharacterized protein PpBr36_10725 [Pyricularia pennisetigena]TLS21048.1 hypothetical protein PpBr36_10725 [Pyricularia pennisetigena]
MLTYPSPDLLSVQAMEHFNPIQNAVSTPWKVQINSEQLSKLKTDHWPEEMEDKWMVSSETREGKTLVHFARSWTGKDMFILTIEEAGDEGAQIETLTWNSGDDDTPKSDEAEAKAMVIRLSKSLLGCELS